MTQGRKDWKPQNTSESGGFLSTNTSHDPGVPGSRKLARMRGEIAGCKPGLVHQEEEVCAFDDVEVCHDHEPCWLVDQAVDSSDGWDLGPAQLHTINSDL